jgi:hypothetical protein
MKLGNLAALLAAIFVVGVVPAEADPAAKTIMIDRAHHRSYWKSHVATAYVDDDDTPVDQRRCCSTGDLHIIYSDGASVAVHLNRRDFPDLADFSSVRTAGDGETVGWTEGVYTGAGSPYPVHLDIFRGGELILHSADADRVVWFWEFLNGGSNAVAIFGPAHGAACGTYQLYDLRHGHGKVGDVPSDQPGVPCLGPAAPAWAQRAERDYRDWIMQ